MAPNRVRNFLAFTLTNALQPALRLLLLPVFAALLGPDGMGRVAFIDAIILFVAVASSAGVHHFFLRQYYHTERGPLFATLTKFLILHNVAILALCLAFGIALLDSVTDQLCLALAATTNFLSAILILPLRELRLHERAFRYGATYAGMAVGQTALALFLVWVGWGVVGWFVGYALGIAPFALWYGLRSIPRLHHPFQRTILRDALALGIASSFNALGMMALSIADRIQIKALAGYEPLGVYSVGYALGIGVSFISTALYTTFEPSLYRPAHVDRAFTRMFARHFAVSYILIVAATTAIELAIEPAASLLLDKRFAPAVDVTRVVALCGMYGLSHLFFTLIGIRLNSKRILVTATFIGATLNILANAVWIPDHGIIGAAYATFAGYVATIAVYSILFIELPELRPVYFASLVIPCAMLAVLVAETYYETPLSALAVPATALAGVLWMARLGNVAPNLGKASA